MIQIIHKKPKLRLNFKKLKKCCLVFVFSLLSPGKTVLFCMFVVWGVAVTVKRIVVRWEDTLQCL